MSDVLEKPIEVTVNATAEALKSYVDRIERLESEKKGISDDIKDLLAESKSRGFNPKAIREVVKRRKVDPDERDSFEEEVVHYMNVCEGR